MAGSAGGLSALPPACKPCLGGAPNPLHPPPLSLCQANGDWTTVFIPWHEFVLVKRARSVPDYPPLDPARIRQFGLVLSRWGGVGLGWGGGGRAVSRH